MLNVMYNLVKYCMYSTECVSYKYIVLYGTTILLCTVEYLPSIH